MNSPLSNLRNYLVSSAVFALTGLGVGCVITTGSLDCDECGGIGCNSQEVGGECFCDANYEWEDPNDDENFECNRIPPKSGECDQPNSFVEGDQCFCNQGFNWCTSDPNDFTCCEDPDQAMDDGDPTGGQDDGNDDVADDGGSGDTAGTADDGADSESGMADDTTGGGAVCEETPADPSGFEPEDADCTKNGLAFCSNVDPDNVAGSRYWLCMDGAWIESPEAGDEICEFDGFDFAYGCTDTEDGIVHDCGVGPGTDCSGAECSGCVDSDLIQSCDSNKLSEDSCARICSEDGDAEGITYDFGECVVGDAGPECACCDEGDEGCNA